MEREKRTAVQNKKLSGFRFWEVAQVLFLNLLET